MMKMRVAVILPAAGVGSRYFAKGKTRGQSSKVELDLGGEPMFLRSVEAFSRRSEVVQILLAVGPGELDAFRGRWAERLEKHHVTIVAGGVKDRWETVQCALGWVEDRCTHVAIHDAARPLVSQGLIDRVFVAAKEHDAVVPAIACSSTIKRVENNGGVQHIVETVDRSDLVFVQTPQIFTLELIRRAYAQGAIEATDDAGWVELLGERVVTVEGEATNLKVTCRGDLEVAKALVGGIRD